MQKSSYFDIQIFKQTFAFIASVIHSKTFYNLTFSALITQLRTIFYTEFCVKVFCLTLGLNYNIQI